MCLRVNKNNEKMTDLTHVKILAKAASNLRNVSIGVYIDGGFYKFEAVNARNYICVTVKIEDVWQWQQ